jgi:hydrogenase maturation protease
MEFFRESATDNVVPTPPVLVLGLGNVLLGDDGVGPALLHMVRQHYAGSSGVECIDGGTQGLALLGFLADRRTVVLLDAFSAHKKPGALTILDKNDILGGGARRATTAHEGNAGELLAVAQLLGDLPAEVFLIGIEPENIRTEFGLSANVASALPAACACALEIIQRSTREALSVPA